MVNEPGKLTGAERAQGKARPANLLSQKEAGRKKTTKNF